MVADSEDEFLGGTIFIDCMCLTEAPYRFKVVEDHDLLPEG